MISCYFILLMNIHKKQNGQLARPFIAQVWLFLFRECRPQSTAGWPLRSLLLTPSPARPATLALIPAMSGQHPSSSASRTHLLFSFPNHLLLSFSPLLPQPDFLTAPLSS